MAYLASTETVDTVSSDGTCVYGAEALGGTPVETTVKVNNETLEIIAGTPFYECDDISDIIEGQSVTVLYHVNQELEDLPQQ